MRAVLLIVLSSFTPVSFAQQAEQITGGLIADEGWELVQMHCSSCHSLQLVTSNRGDRATWLHLIRWMQKTQNLWPIDAASEDQILTYLDKNYPPDNLARRKPLPHHLLPGSN